MDPQIHPTNHIYYRRFSLQRRLFIIRLELRLSGERLSAREPKVRKLDEQKTFMTKVETI
jgi:hypothetical protein